MLTSNTGLFNFFVSRTITSSITFYQKHLSPLKGYSCAHRIFHNSESCSQYVKRAFEEQNFPTALSLTRQRFKDCALAAQELKNLAAKSDGCSCENCCSDSQGNECGCLSCCCLGSESRQCCKNYQKNLGSPECWEGCFEAYEQDCSSPRKISDCTLSCCTFGIYGACCSGDKT